MSRVFSTYCGNDAIRFEHCGEKFTLSFLDVASILIQDQHPLLVLAREFSRGARNRNVQYTFFRDGGIIEDEITFENGIRSGFVMKLRQMMHGDHFNRIIETATRLLMVFYATNQNTLPGAEKTFSVSFDVSAKEQDDLKLNLEWFKGYCMKRNVGDTHTCSQLREALNSHRRNRGEESYGQKTPAWLGFQRETMDRQEEFRIVWTGSASHRVIRFGSVAVSTSSLDPKTLEEIRDLGKNYLLKIAHGATTLEGLFEKFVTESEPGAPAGELFKAKDLHQYMVKLSHAVPGLESPTTQQVRRIRRLVEEKNLAPENKTLPGGKPKRGTNGASKLKRKYPETTEEDVKMESCKVIKMMLSGLEPKTPQESSLVDSVSSSRESLDERLSFKIFSHQSESIITLYGYFVEMGSKTNNSNCLTRKDMVSIATYASWFKINLDAEFFGPLLLDLEPSDHIESSSLWVMAGYFYFHDAGIKNRLCCFNPNYPATLMDVLRNLSLPNHLKYGEWYGVPSNTSDLTPHVIPIYVPPKRVVW